MVFSNLRSKLSVFAGSQTLCSSKTISHHQGSVQDITPRFNLKDYVLLGLDKYKVHIFSTVMCLCGERMSKNSSFLLGNTGMRFSHGYQSAAHSYRLHGGFTIRGNPSFMWRRLIRTPRSLLFVPCALLILYCSRLERIPYSKRCHVVLSSEKFERWVGDKMVKETKEYYKGYILPPNNPQSIRVQAILGKLVQAMHSGLRQGKEPNSRTWGSEVGQFSPRFGTKHLDGLNWEVMVVNSYENNACYLSNGKIVLHSTLLTRLNSDAEVAAVLGHEMGHGVARHISEDLLRRMWMITTLPVLFFVPFLGISVGLGYLFLSRRREMEADYIGMMLMASAGYDPRLAPPIELKLDDSDDNHHDLYSTHPCGRKRAEKLNKTEVMEQAVAIYKEVRSGHGVRSFI